MKIFYVLLIGWASAHAQQEAAVSGSATIADLRAAAATANMLDSVSADARGKRSTIEVSRDLIPGNSYLLGEGVIAGQAEVMVPLYAGPDSDQQVKESQGGKLSCSVYGNKPAVPGDEKMKLPVNQNLGLISTPRISQTTQGVTVVNLDFASAPATIGQSYNVKMTCINATEKTTLLAIEESLGNAFKIRP